MNKLMYIGLIAILFSCKSNSIAQENAKNKTEKPKVEKPKFGDTNNGDMPKPNVFTQNQIAPNTIHLTVEVMELYSNKLICDVSQEAAVNVKIKEIKGSGSGLVNRVSINKEIILALRKGISKDITYLKSKLSKDIFIIIREKPCMNFNQTMYEIVGYEYRQ
ncbi:hypothetical protein D1815_17245 [Aquimarina sp. AD1]|uniref:hypothetical protein n=1 Tax=Aquimarina sp. (strain AD1) TaxID=1714848 RepID=UPI000E4DDF5C|nr:hypothetical protein [Aquimarina sp. AD1]AXT57404.1 hypothetical protein D1815_17245 [Aquimarina sp. AD1]RKN32728.1 hypothetical protein D7035_05215 [Aquimarina sp. AD1]